MPRKKVETTKFRGEKTQPLGKLTISMGLATFKKPEASKHSLINSADELLYEAKKQGRNILKKKYFEGNGNNNH